MTIDNYYRQEREEIIKLLGKDRLAKTNKTKNLLKEIEVDWKEFLLLKQSAKNLRRLIRRKYILLNMLRNMKE